VVVAGVVFAAVLGFPAAAQATPQVTAGDQPGWWICAVV
jgi:hypothetical protein